MTYTTVIKNKMDELTGAMHDLETELFALEMEEDKLHGNELTNNLRKQTVINHLITGYDKMIADLDEMLESYEN